MNNRTEQFHFFATPEEAKLIRDREKEIGILNESAYLRKMAIDGYLIQMSTYLDYNASAPIDLRVLDCMVDVYKNSIGNADSRTHGFGEKARSVVEDARKQVATLLGTSSDEVFFTSGATESNNIAIRGLVDYGKKNGKMHIITTAIEHKAVLETVKHLSENGFEVEFIKPGINGRVNAPDVLDKVREDTLLVSVMHVNNETGIIQPVKEIGDALAQRNVLFHVDATQSCGKLVDEIRVIKYNMLSFSAHKLMGPQGIGVLVLKKNRYKLPPVKNIMYGGQQEHGIRPGTIPVMGSQTNNSFTGKGFSEKKLLLLRHQRTFRLSQTRQMKPAHKRFRSQRSAFQ